MASEPDESGHTGTDEPRVEHRDLQRYVALRQRIPACNFARAVDVAWPLVSTWLAERDVAPSGQRIIRYCAIDDEGLLEIDLGVLVGDTGHGAGSGPPIGEELLAAIDEVHRGLLPAGRYVVARHRGPYDGLAGAHARLARWAAQHGIVFDRWRKPGAEQWRCNVERYLVDPATEPDPSRWIVELAYLTVG